MEEILAKYWQELNSIIDRLATGQSDNVDRDIGRAQNAGYFIAIMENPNQPNIIEVLERAKSTFDQEVAN